MASRSVGSVFPSAGVVWCQYLPSTLNHRSRGGSEGTITERNVPSHDSSIDRIPNEIDGCVLNSRSPGGAKKSEQNERSNYASFD